MVALVLVGGIGISTEASRRWIFQIRDVILESLGTSIKNNFTEGDSVRILNKDEQKAETDLREKLRISQIRF